MIPAAAENPKTGPKLTRHTAHARQHDTGYPIIRCCQGRALPEPPHRPHGQPANGPRRVHRAARREL